MLGWPQTCGPQHAARSRILFTLFFYSMWLNARTPQEQFVIGGGCGAFHRPVIGWISPPGQLPLSRAWRCSRLNLHVDTPHFWAFALFMRNDMTTRKGPMLTVDPRFAALTRRHISGLILFCWSFWLS